MEFSQEQIDALTEVFNIGVGRAAASLGDLLGTRIELRVPQIQIKPCLESQEAGLAILQSFEGGVSGTALLAFPTDSGQQLAKLLGGYGPDDDLPAIELSGILSEVGNIVLNGVLGSFANMIETDLTYCVPDFFVDHPLEDLVQNSSSNATPDSIVVADTNFSVLSENISGSVVLAFELGSLKSLLARLVEPTSVE